MGAVCTSEQLISQGRGYSLKKPGIKVSSIFLKSITANPHKTDLQIVKKKCKKGLKRGDRLENV